MPLIGGAALVALVVIAIVAGGVAAVVGFGIGSLLTPAVALSIGTKAAVVVVAVPHAAATAVRMWGLRSDVDSGVLLRFGIASAAGGLCGAVLHGAFGSPLLTLVLGGLLVISGLSELTGWARRVELSAPASALVGLLSGLFGGLVGNQGGIRSAALLRFGLSRERLVATATATALLVDAARLPVYVVTSGSDLVAYWPIVLTLTAAVVAGTLLGVPILRRLPEATFRRTIATVLVALGLGVIATAWVA